MARPVNPPALSPVEVTVPQWHALTKMQRRVQVVRSAVGRVATLAGAASAAAGLFTGHWTGVSLLADAALTLGGLATLRLWKPDGHQKATATVLYLMPGGSLACLLVAEQWVPGIHPLEAAALATWTVGTWVARPADVARRMVSPPPRVPSTTVAPLPAEVCDHPAARWWAQKVAIDGGAAPGTLLEDIERTGETAVRAVVRSAVPGQPVPDISIMRLSALMDVPEDLIAIGPVPGRGSAYRLLQVGRPDEDVTPAAVWANRIAPDAMPGTVLTSVRTGRPADRIDEEG
ncbi:hypothetical protein [Nonomuraea sp. SYSU D8015]|uniref:hypothetical protein n=1 Tax=Nonomuraea sp. SYSU D8015 TaxID=2593644 RepID=UPI0016600EB3|nr:hypothetical protein [Nonomuraea sp. SYSU D8015]